MGATTKTPWKKHLDKRYISGEDLKNGIEMNKGLRPEMVVTLASFNDAKTFDQKQQEEKDKTAIWLNEYPFGKKLYKPLILNVANADFLSAEIGNGGINIDDADFTKPFVLYAKPDKRHGWVARLKKYYPPAAILPDRALKILTNVKSKDEFKTAWSELISKEEKQLPQVMAKKDELIKLYQ